MEEIEEKIEELKKEYQDKLKEIDTIRRQLVNLRATMINNKYTENQEYLRLPPVEDKILKLAEEIPLREAIYVVNLCSYLAKLERARIKNLKELYIMVEDGSIIKARGIGEISMKVIGESIKDLPNVIQMVSKRRENIKNNNVKIDILLDNDYTLRVLRKKNIRTLEQLYNQDVRTYNGIMDSVGKENEIISLIQTY